MAYVSKQIPDDQENIFARTEATTPVPQGGGSAGSEPNGAAPGVGTPTQFGSNAAKLTDYLNANKGRVQQFGQDVAGRLTNSYDTTLGNINQGFNQFSNDVSGSYTPPTQEQVNSALSKPEEFSKDSSNVDQFRQWYNPSYSGPQNFEGSSMYSNLNDQVNKAVDNSKLVDTLPGLSTFLGQSNQYATPGMNALDSALLYRSPEARGAIQSAAAPAKTLNDYLSSKAGEANQAVANKKNEISSSGENVRNLSQNAFNQFNNDLQDRVSTARGQSAADADLTNRLLRAGSANGFSNEELQKVANDLDLAPGGAEDDLSALNSLLARRAIVSKGFTPDISSGLTPVAGRNVDLSQFLTLLPSEQITPGNLATPEDYARSAALAQMTGLSPYLDQEMASQAGTAPLDLTQTAIPQNFLDMDANELSKLWANYYASKNGLPGVVGIS